MVRAFLVLVLLFLPTVAHAQVPTPESIELHVLPLGTSDPNAVPVATRSTTITSGIPTCNLDKVTATTAPVNPQWVYFDDPFNGPTRDCRAPLPASSVPDGIGYSAAAEFVATCGGAPCRSVRNAVTGTFTRQTVIPIDCTGAVVVSVGNWTRSAGPSTLMLVSYSLLSSQQPVTLLIVRLGSTEIYRVTGTDLRGFAASQFRLPSVRGTYALSVEAQDVRGCSAQDARPMTVVVK